MVSYIRRDAERIWAEVEPETDLPPNAASLFLVYAVLMRAKGATVDAADVHDAWAAWCEMTGVDSPSLVEFDRLADDVRLADEPFVRAIRAVAAAAR